MKPIFYVIHPSADIRTMCYANRRLALDVVTSALLFIKINWYNDGL